LLNDIFLLLSSFNKRLMLKFWKSQTFHMRRSLAVIEKKHIAHLKLATRNEI